MTHNIIAMTNNHWDYPWWMDRQHLMSRLAERGWGVVFTNGTLHVWNRKKRRWLESRLTTSFERREFGSGYVLVHKAARLLASTGRLEVWDRAARRLTAEALKAALPTAPMRKLIVYICHPKFVNYIDHLAPDAIVLHVYDAWWQNKSWTESLQAGLESVVKRADLIVCLAETMSRDLPLTGAGRARILNPGVDYQSVQQALTEPCPNDLREVPPPRIGYVGRLTQKIDFKLIGEVARARPDLHWCFVGMPMGFTESASNEKGRQLSAIAQLGNVHVFGPRGGTDGLRYLVHFDVLCLPYDRSEGGYWQAVFPFKFFECCATGRPIVATPIESLLPYKNVIDFASSTDEWIAALDRLLEGEKPERAEERLSLASENTWEKRTDVLEDWLSSIVE